MFSKISIKLSHSSFTKYKSSPIFLSNAGPNIVSLTNQALSDYTNPSFPYLRTDVQELEVSYCTFTRCSVTKSWTNFSLEGYEPDNCGGAIYAVGSNSAVIRQTVFTDCVASSQGGAIYLENIQTEAEISGCYFVRVSGYLGDAILIRTMNASIFNCHFELCSSRLITTDSNTFAGTIYIFGSQSHCSVLYCSFTGSGFTEESSATFGEVTAIHNRNEVRTDPLIVRDICVMKGTPTVPIKADSHVAVIVYITNTPPSVSNIYIQENTEIYELFYYDQTGSPIARKSQQSVTDCVTIHVTPQPTPFPTVTTIYIPPTQTQPQPQPQPTATQFVTQSAFPSVTPENSDSGPKINTKAAIIASCAVIGAIVVIILIILLILFITKDRRTAFNGEGNSSEELAYPEIENEENHTIPDM